MIHHQRRRDLAASTEQPRDAHEEAPEARHDSVPDTHATSTQPAADVSATPPAVPRQERRDAYDLYAQIYALRTEEPTA
jgi:hypothetical protein